MSRSKANETNIRKLTKLGGHSIGVTLPIGLVRALGWREKQKVRVTKQNGALVVRDWKKR
jgi:antitoxin component of MazEF toxin-antitoxin module